MQPASIIQVKSLEKDSGVARNCYKRQEQVDSIEDRYVLLLEKVKVLEIKVMFSHKEPAIGQREGGVGH
jgi:hypothetical protein